MTVFHIHLTRVKRQPKETTVANRGVLTLLFFLLCFLLLTPSHLVALNHAELRSATSSFRLNVMEHSLPCAVLFIAK